MDLRHFSVENSAFFRCDPSVTLPCPVFHVCNAIYTCFACICNPKETWKWRWSLCVAFFVVVFFLLLHFPGNAVVLWLVTNIVLLLVRRQVLVFPFKGCKGFWRVPTRCPDACWWLCPWTGGRGWRSSRGLLHLQRVCFDPSFLLIGALCATELPGVLYAKIN